MLRNAFQRFRNALRMHPLVAQISYTVANQRCRLTGRLAKIPVKVSETQQSVAVCLRFRDEARYLSEWLDYYIAAGISHFFLYNNNSSDDYEAVVAPYVDRGVVTLIEWPYVPASPAAEEDCIQRAMGKFAWVGFLDADEFVVIRSGESIPDFLHEFSGYPGVALHWYFYGSNGHQKRPDLPVIQAYTRRRATPDGHLKLFVRPESVTQCNNSHSWFFRHGRAAVDESRKPVWGSRSENRNAHSAWINHYYTKSAEDYQERIRQKITLDRQGMKAPSRTVDSMRHHLTDNNQVECFAALEYLAKRRSENTSF